MGLRGKKAKVLEKVLKYVKETYPCSGEDLVGLCSFANKMRVEGELDREELLLCYEIIEEVMDQHHERFLRMGYHTPCNYLREYLRYIHGVQSDNGLLELWWLTYQNKLEELWNYK